MRFFERYCVAITFIGMLALSAKTPMHTYDSEIYISVTLCGVMFIILAFYENIAVNSFLNKMSLREYTASALAWTLTALTLEYLKLYLNFILTLPFFIASMVAVFRVGYIIFKIKWLNR